MARNAKLFAPARDFDAFGRHGARHLDRQVGPVHDEHDEHHEREDTGRHERDAPRERERDRHQDRGRERPAEAAGDAVDAERMAEARRIDLAIEQRVVDRMEDAVADPGDGGEADQHRVARARREAERGAGEQGDAAEQDRSRPESVDDESGDRLHRARDDEEHA